MGVAQLKPITKDPRPDIAIGHVGLRVKDLKASVEFLSLAGIRVVGRMPNMAILELRGGTHIVVRHDPQAQNSYAPFDLMVDDIKEMHSRLSSAGHKPGKITRNMIHKSFEITDPSGMIFEFTSSHATGPV